MLRRVTRPIIRGTHMLAVCVPGVAAGNWPEPSLQAAFDLQLQGYSFPFRSGGDITCWSLSDTNPRTRRPARQNQPQ